MRRLALAALVVLAAGACGDSTPSVLEDHPACRMAVRVMADADPDATEDDVRGSLADITSDEEELLDMCMTIADDLCSGVNQEPLPQCPGE